MMEFQRRDNLPPSPNDYLLSADTCIAAAKIPQSRYSTSFPKPTSTPSKGSKEEQGHSVSHLLDSEVGGDVLLVVAGMPVSGYGMLRFVHFPTSSLMYFTFSLVWRPVDHFRRHRSRCPHQPEGHVRAPSIILVLPHVALLSVTCMSFGLIAIDGRGVERVRSG